MAGVLLPLELLNTDNIGTNDLGSLDALGVGEFTDHLGAFLPFLLGSLDRDELVSLQFDNCSYFTTVGSGVFELLSIFEFELHGLQGGGGLDGPDFTLLGNLKNDIQVKNRVE